MEAFFIGIAAASFANVLFLALGYMLGANSTTDIQEDKEKAAKNRIINELVDKLEGMKEEHDETYKVYYAESEGFTAEEKPE